MKSWRKWGAVIVMAVVCMSCILFMPQSAVRVMAEGNVTTGTLGDNNGITWTYDENTRTLTVTGEDSGMENYPLSNISLPDYVEKVVFRDCKIIGSANYLMSSLYQLKSVEFFNFDTSDVTSMQEMFCDCGRLKSLDLSSFDTSNVTSMYCMFFDCNSLESLNLSSFDTGNVTDMSSMFEDCKSLKSLDLRNFDTRKVTNMYCMFYGCDGLEGIDLSSFDTGNVTFMTYMFHRCKSLRSLNLDSFDTRNVIGMNHMFEYCSSLESIDLSSFDTGNVTDMYHMFNGCNGLKSIDLSSFDIGNADTIWMFNNCNSIEKIYTPKAISAEQTIHLPGTFYDSQKNSITELTKEHCNKTLVKNIDDATAQPPASTLPTPVFAVSAIPKEVLKYDKDAGYNMNQINLDISATYNIPNDNINHKDVQMIMELSDGFSFSKTESVTSKTENLGTVDNKNLTKKVSVPIYISKKEYVKELVIKISFAADGYSTSQVETISIPIELVENEQSIAVFTTEPSFSIKTGESMWLAFGLLKNGELDGVWQKMAVTVSDPSVLSLSDYKGTEYGYSIEVKGKKEGSAHITVTDTQSGENTVLLVSVYDAYVRTYSYNINEIATFYPQNKWEYDIATNIYNINGMYVNNYKCEKAGGKYKVSFDAYNSKYYTGAVDIFDANGEWIGSEEIEKYASISSLWDTGEQLVYLVTDTVSGKMITYEQASFSKHTPVKFEVPEGGYFTISNNFSKSPGTFFYNMSDILFNAMLEFMKDAPDIKIEWSDFAKMLMGQVWENPNVKEKFMEIFESSMIDMIGSFGGKLLSSEVNDAYSNLITSFENVLNSMDISWKNTFKTATGVGESVFTKFSGPAGPALEFCFAFAKGTDRLLQASQMSASMNEAYVTVYSSLEEGEINPHGVVIHTNGNMEENAVLQVFKISDDDVIDVMLDGSDPLQQYEMYNISFVKDDKLVQPNGKVKVYLPIPEGMNGTTCKVYRQEADGSWKILNAHVEGNYLVFETDHFSLYAIIGNIQELSITSLPNKLRYTEGEVLDASGLVLSLNGKQIADGYVCEPTVLSGNGKQTITVKYGRTSTQFEVAVQTDASKFNGLRQAEDGNWYYYVDGVINSSFTGLYHDIECGWWLVKNGKVAFDYTGLWYDQTYGWWLVGGGRVCFEYTGLWCDPTYGWWLIGGGTVCFDYTGLWNDPNCGWWLIGGGTVCFDYTGLWNDPNCGWWLIGGGTVCFDYTGLWNDPNCGWWLIGGGCVAFDYTGLWCDPNYGWWLIGGGCVAFDYTGLWCDPNYGWWLIGGGCVAFDYTGLWGDPNYGWWYIENGAIHFGYTGQTYYDGVPYQVVNGQLA